MEKKNSENREKKTDRKPKYVQPEIITYTNDDVIKHLGPAQACSTTPCTVSPSGSGF